MKIHYVSMIIIVVAFVVLGLTTYVTDLGTNYNQTSNMDSIRNLSSHFKPMETEAVNLQQNISSIVPQQDDEASDLFLPYKLIRIGLSTIKTLVRSFITLGGLGTKLSQILTEQGVPIPDKIGVLVTVLIYFVMTAMVLFALWKWKIED